MGDDSFFISSSTTLRTTSRAITLFFSGITLLKDINERLGITVRQIPESEITKVISMEQKYGVWAVRSAASICGAAEAWLKENGEPLRFDTIEQAAKYAEGPNAGLGTANVRYYPKEAGPELLPAPRMGMKLC